MTDESAEILDLNINIDDDDLDFELQPQNFGKVKSRHRKVKKGAKAAMGAAGVGVQGAQTGSGISLMGAVAGTAGVIGTGGTLLLVAGTAMTVVGSGLAARSSYRTNKHINNLKALYENRHTYFCDGCKADHSHLAETILPYIIRKKRAKLYRKGAQIVPGASMLEKSRAIGKNLYKRARRTQGQQRTFSAEQLTAHMITCNCDLAEAIVSELFSPEEMAWLKLQDNDVAAPLIAEKMKSV